jgi:hypothetical protein
MYPQFPQNMVGTFPNLFLVYFGNDIQRLFKASRLFPQDCHPYLGNPNFTNQMHSDIVASLDTPLYLLSSGNLT